jgi:hypothetical protein
MRPALSDSDDDENSSSSSSASEDEPTPPPKKQKLEQRKPQLKKPEMKIISSTARPQATTAVHDSFEALLALQASRQTNQKAPESRPNGEMQTTWKPNKSKRADDGKANKEGRPQMKAARRSASKNVFRKMGK